MHTTLYIHSMPVRCKCQSCRRIRTCLWLGACFIAAGIGILFG